MPSKWLLQWHKAGCQQGSKKKNTSVPLLWKKYLQKKKYCLYHPVQSKCQRRFGWGHAPELKRLVTSMSLLLPHAWQKKVESVKLDYSVLVFKMQKWSFPQKMLQAHCSSQNPVLIVFHRNILQNEIPRMNVHVCKHVSLIQLLVAKITEEHRLDGTPAPTKFIQFYTNPWVL